MNLEQLHKELHCLADNARRNNQIITTINNTLEKPFDNAITGDPNNKKSSTGLLEELFIAAKEINSLLDLQWGMLQQTQRYIQEEKLEACATSYM